MYACTCSGSIFFLHSLLTPKYLVKQRQWTSYMSEETYVESTVWDRGDKSTLLVVLLNMNNSSLNVCSKEITIQLISHQHVHAVNASYAQETYTILMVISYRSKDVYMSSLKHRPSKTLLQWIRRGMTQNNLTRGGWRLSASTAASMPLAYLCLSLMKY